MNEDIWQLLEAAQTVAAGNPKSSAPVEVRDRAKSRVAALGAALREAQAQVQANAPVSDVDETIRRVFHGRLPLPLQMKDVVVHLQAAFADASELVRKAEQFIHDCK
jgi:hypothetical protein